MRSALRKIIFLIAIPVFLFSTFMVLKYRHETRATIAYTDSMAQSVVSFTEKQAANALPASLTGTESPQAVQTPGDAESPLAPTQAPESIETATDAAQPTQSPESIHVEEAPIDATPSPEIFIETSDAVCPIQVDFDALRQQNKDVIGWLYCPDTPINYPVVQSTDNDYYIHRRLDGKNHSAGTLFMDYRNTPDLSDWNCVIYGHNMKNGTMFGCLPRYKKQAYFEEHPTMFLLTPEQNYAIEIMAGFVTEADAALYTAFSPDADEKEALIRQWLEKADVPSNVHPSENSRFVTLSTCSYEYDNARYVLIGILKQCQGDV